MTVKLRKVFGLPSPVELGKSKYNALPMRGFGAEPGDYTWQDWREEVKTKYPIKYFLAETVPLWFTVHISKPIDEFIYKYKSLLYKKEYLLDLRQPHTDTEDDYKYGWADECNQLVFACFNILTKFAEEYELGRDKELQESIDKSDNEDEKTMLQDCLDRNKIIVELHQYWTIDRKVEFKKRDRALTDWHDNKEEDEANGRPRWDLLKKLEDEFDQKEEEMLIKLIKIRKSLWY